MAGMEGQPENKGEGVREGLLLKFNQLAFGKEIDS